MTQTTQPPIGGLVLTRKPLQGVQIGDDVRVVVHTIWQDGADLVITGDGDDDRIIDPRFGDVVEVGPARIAVQKLDRTGACRLVIDAPRDVRVLRDELVEGAR